MEGPLQLREEGGIPPAPFIEDVEEYMRGEEGVEQALKKTQAMYNQYKALEGKLMQHKANLKGKLPDIQQALDLVRHLASRRPEGGDEAATTTTTTSSSSSSTQVRAHFEVSEGLYARAVVEDVGHVGLWLGANVMVEYTCDEAALLLARNVANCKANLAGLDRDLDFIKDQITTTEVNIARIYNFDVKLRRASRASSSPPATSVSAAAST